MTGEKSLEKLLKTMKPVHNPGEFVFCKVENLNAIDVNLAVCLFKEEEATTIILKKEIADQLGLEYDFIASWITLTVHSSLTAVGLTAAFSTALSEHGISCNVVAAYYHDHIFVDLKDTVAAMDILKQLSE
ncbi:ACT domain-containing protein [Pedobacter sp. HDW13]|uniref:ACT domain-containing protein n=1 Tax=unclassified Pedobacter TaxID=2628915 RepID=UPI000F5B864D|nr:MULTISPECIES: ACT domain-containing protein [unclassified Pedobacter]QIL40076.1 ACT domain-containing protein [Pedobacter sp. HDW13]RQO68320.1 acetyltransferase [Pedobacter sp. KBW01]